jgi:hypothetical protein
MRYAVADFMKCAFAVFFFQHQSLLDFQRRMKERVSRNNLETVFGVSEIPTDTKIRTVMDQIEPGQLGPVFHTTLKTADEAHLLEGYRVLDGGVLIALDGVWYMGRKTATASGVYTRRQKLEWDGRRVKRYAFDLRSLLAPVGRRV